MAREDLGAYVRICADPEAWRYMHGGTVTRRQAEERIARLVHNWEERDYGPWAAEDKASGAFIGEIGLQYRDDWPEGGKVELSLRGETRRRDVDVVWYASDRPDWELEADRLTG